MERTIEMLESAVKLILEKNNSQIAEIMLENLNNKIKFGGLYEGVDVEEISKTMTEAYANLADKKAKEYEAARNASNPDRNTVNKLYAQKTAYERAEAEKGKRDADGRRMSSKHGDEAKRAEKVWSDSDKKDDEKDSKPINEDIIFDYTEDDEARAIRLINSVEDEKDKALLRTLLDKIQYELNSKKYQHQYEDTSEVELTEAEDVEYDVKHEGLLEIPDGKAVSELPYKHFVNLVEKKGYARIIRALNNLHVWNKNDDVKLSNWAKDMMYKLRKEFRPELIEEDIN